MEVKARWKKMAPRVRKGRGQVLERSGEDVLKASNMTSMASNEMRSFFNVWSSRCGSMAGKESTCQGGNAPSDRSDSTVELDSPLHQTWVLPHHYFHVQILKEHCMAYRYQGNSNLGVLTLLWPSSHPFRFWNCPACSRLSLPPIFGISHCASFSESLRPDLCQIPWISRNDLFLAFSCLIH